MMDFNIPIEDNLDEKLAKLGKKICPGCEEIKPREDFCESGLCDVCDDSSRKCQKCGDIKPRTGFETDSSRKEGITTTCKVCLKISRDLAKKGIKSDLTKKRELATHINDIFFKVELKKCSTCGYVKSIDDFYQDDNSKNKLSHNCKTCRSLIKKGRRANMMDWVLDNIRELSSPHRQQYLHDYKLPSLTGKKICTGCNKNKSLREFKINFNTESGLSDKCTKCLDKINGYINNKKALDDAAAKINLLLMDLDMRICLTCGHIKKVDGFGSSTKNRDGKKTRCKVCNNLLDNAYKKGEDDSWIRQNMPDLSIKDAVIKKGDINIDDFDISSIKTPKRTYGRKYHIIKGDDRWYNLGTATITEPRCLDIDVDNHMKNMKELVMNCDFSNINKENKLVKILKNNFAFKKGDIFVVNTNTIQERAMMIKFVHILPDKNDISGTMIYDLSTTTSSNKEECTLKHIDMLQFKKFNIASSNY